MGLSERDGRLARVSVAIVLGLWDVLRELRVSAPAGEPDRGWREAVLQTHLFGGFPKGVEALAVLEAAGGLGPPDEEDALDEAAAVYRGRALFRRIYGESSAELESGIARRGGPFVHWVLAHAYGRVLTRPGLAADRREILAVVCLTAVGPERQLAAHLRGALRCGAAPSELEEALDQVADLVDRPRLVEARRLLARLSR